MRYLLRQSSPLGAHGISPRFKSTFTVKRPPPSATREVPTPLVFCSAGEWVPRAHTRLFPHSSFLAERGFTCIETNFTRPLGSGMTTSEELMKHCSDALRKNLWMSGAPFPPVIFASGFASLIAQTYISSNPAQGLFLISPPPSNASLYPDILPTPLAEFTYEPQFPLAVMAQPEDMATLRTQSRFSQSVWVDLIEAEDLEGKQALEKIEQWLDELGI
ncbi:hypothetical protein BDN67DRAFT_1000573 [Paxillus ammoniavirescens]|nr:hypothetical protein BDN67DRAFT_1000573 [Paxillus ammoniavirescens]